MHTDFSISRGPKIRKGVHNAEHVQIPPVGIGMESDGEKEEQRSIDQEWRSGQSWDKIATLEKNMHMHRYSVHKQGSMTAVRCHGA